LQGDRRSVMLLSSHAFGRPGGRRRQVTAEDVPQNQSFAVQLINRYWIALLGCISFPAIRQTLAVRMMLCVVARANTYNK